MRGRRRRRNLKDSSHEYESTSGHTKGSSYQGHSRLLRDKSNKSRGRGSLSLRRERCRHPSVSLDAMSRALRRVAWSPFSKEIECTEMPRHFTRLPFTYYDGKTNPIENVIHFT